MRLLFERGIRINETEGLLAGNGKQTCYVQIRRQQDVRLRSLKRLIRAATDCKRG